jgi:hypothetical protein
MPDRLTDLDKKLQEIALVNYTQFVALVGEDAINKAKACLLRQSNNSYGKISQKLGVSRRRAQHICGECRT